MPDRQSPIRSLRGAVAAAASVFIGLLVLVVLSTGGAVAAVGSTDLSLTKTDSPDPATAGNDLTYTIQVQDLGANDASSVVVTDSLPSGVDFVSASGGSCQLTGSTVTCGLGQLNAGTTATVTIVVKTKVDGTLSNTAVVSSPEDSNLANNQETETTSVLKTSTAPLRSCDGKTATIVGTEGDDVQKGTSSRDVIHGLGGNDTLSGLAGNDTICGGAGKDTLKGGKGNDNLLGQAGKDTLKGGGGKDLCKGGNDKVSKCERKKGGGEGNCTPGYSPCIPPGSDVDCAGGGGNGPRFVQGPVTVTGSDPYGLDADNDGIGCET